MKEIHCGRCTFNFSFIFYFEMLETARFYYHISPAIYHILNDLVKKSKFFFFMKARGGRLAIAQNMKFSIIIYAALVYINSKNLIITYTFCFPHEIRST